MAGASFRKDQDFVRFSTSINGLLSAIDQKMHLTEPIANKRQVDKKKSNKKKEPSSKSNDEPSASAPKKLTRRRPRDRSKKKSQNLPKDPAGINGTVKRERCEENAYNFSIKAVKSQSNGLVVRLRNLKCKHINLQCFYKNKIPYVCKSVYSGRLRLNSAQRHESILRETTEKTDVMLDRQIETEPPSSSSSGKKITNKKAVGKSETKQTSKIKECDKFAPYLSHAEVIKGLESGIFVKGVIRINPKRYKEAYVNNINTSIQDYVITSILDRNRALEGDEVVLEVTDEATKTAKVVYILQENHPRTAVGKLIFPEASSNNKFAVFHPRDFRFPILLIPINNTTVRFKKLEDHLFLGKLINWKQFKRGYGTILQHIGPSDSLEAQSQAILSENTLDVSPYPELYNKYIRKIDGIPPEELGYREDFRSECVFTIDPLTAKDLDDAVSCKELPNGNYEIGVHISDASFYLLEGTPLDKMVSKRATTIYMVEKAYHMLPQEMCMNCSLLPGVDKLAFSVVWEINKDAEVVNTHYTRSIINSCVQLAYEHAQLMIDNPEDFEQSGLPSVRNGYSYKDLSKIVNNLQRLAVKMRQKRIENGALKIDQVKVSFELGPDGLPVKFCVQESKEAHRLIEEYMLLANGSVAKKILDSFPDLAFLRRHDAPKVTMMVELQSVLESVGLFIDITSSKGISASLIKYGTDDNLGRSMQAVLNHLLAKPMTRAKYFCTGARESTDYSHFALSIPIYTHFTSPIRRYADIMVHRLLAASLGYCEAPTWNVMEVEGIANVCNLQKYNAKKAGDASSELYLTEYIKNHQPFIEDAAVVAVFEQSFDVIVLNTGTVLRIYSKQFGENVTHASESLTTKETDKKIWKMTLNFPETAQYEATDLIIEIFTLIKVQLRKDEKLNKLEAMLLRPVSL